MGFMGAVAAVNQNFMGWVKISKGEFAFNEQLYIDPFPLSAGSLFIIIGQLWLILTKAPTNGSWRALLLIKQHNSRISIYRKTECNEGVCISPP